MSGALAFLASGGVLSAAGLCAGLTLLLFILESLRRGRPCLPFGLVFLSALAGALLNTLAPGNYVRHSEYGGGFDILGAALNSLRFLWQELTWLLGGTGFPVFLLLALLLGLFISRKQSWAGLTVCVISFLVIPLIAIFPVVLGYNWDGESLANRNLFLIDASMIGSYLAIAVLLGSRLGAGILSPHRKAAALCIGVLALTAALVIGGARESIPVQIAGNFRNGSIQHYSAEWRRIYDYVRDYGEGDVVVTIPAPEETTGCTFAGFTMNPDNWQNSLLAEYFGVDSVRMSS